MLSLSEPAPRDPSHSRAEVTHHASGLGRWEYARATPAPQLRGIARTYVGWIEQMAAPLHRRELPTDEVPLIFNFGAPFHLFVPGGDRRDRDHTSFVTGAYDTFQVVESAGPSSGVQVNLTVLGLRRLAGRPIADLTNLAVSPEEVFGPFARDLRDRVYEAGSWDARFACLDAALLAQLQRRRQLPVPIEYAWSRLTRSAGRVAIGEIVSEIGWSQRHFTTQFTRELGIAPKLLARILRFTRVVEGIKSGGITDLADAALAAGYYDQPHLHRDVRAFAGVTPRALVASLLPDGGGFLA